MISLSFFSVSSVFGASSTSRVSSDTNVSKCFWFPICL